MPERRMSKKLLFFMQLFGSLWSGTQSLPGTQITAEQLWTQLRNSFLIKTQRFNISSLSLIERHEIGVETHKHRPTFTVYNFAFKSSYTFSILMNEAILMTNISTWSFHRLVWSPPIPNSSAIGKVKFWIQSYPNPKDDANNLNWP